MSKNFQIAAGTIIGKYHTRLGKNNQDAYYTFQSNSLTIAIVADGCGSGKNTEVGAKLAVKLLGEILVKRLENYPNADFWSEVQQDLLELIQVLAVNMGDNLSQIVIDYFLFTLIGVIITEEITTIFSLGDGIIILNDKITQLGPFPHNAPPYFAYNLIPHYQKYDFKINHQLPTDQVQSILIGTDGVEDLILSHTKNIPGKEELVGDINQFWQEDIYFQNPDMIRRKLSLINTDITQGNWFHQELIKYSGLLSDDTTLIVIKKNLDFS
ncbi:MAG TPA: protein phosphatase 2C domain-containing protein [Allocoleopsis sp.]